MKTSHAVVGVKFKNEDKTPRQLLLGYIYDDYWTEAEEDKLKLELRREPDNEVDPNAVGVWCVAPRGKVDEDDPKRERRDPRGRLGFIPRDENQRLSELLDQGKVPTIEIKKMSCGRGAQVSMVITVAFEDTKRAKARSKQIVDSEGRVYDLD